ncbi:MAG: hypothetical protein IPN53_07760 [Comamonadaceae bacterium]|nr:hypothetical protein [Comamonadaceae bacterium]
MQTTIAIIYIVTSAFLAWGFVAYAAYRMANEGFGCQEFTAAFFTPLFTTLVIALFQQGDYSITALFPFEMLSYGGDSISYLAQSRMIIEYVPTPIQYPPGFAAFITPLVLLARLLGVLGVLGGTDGVANITLITVNYIIIFPLIFLLLYKSVLHLTSKESNLRQLLTYAVIYILVIIIYVCIPPGYMITKNVLTASHRILGLVVVYEPLYYFCFALMFYMTIRINNHRSDLILGLLIGFSVMVTERSILWLFPIVSYYLLMLNRNNLLIIKALALIFAGVALVVSWYIFYNYLFYDNVLHDLRGSYWLNRCLHWASRLNSLYPGLISQCPPRLSVEYIPYNFNRLVNDYWGGLVLLFVLIATLISKVSSLLTASLVLITLLNAVVALAYINPQTIVKYNSILIWPTIFSVAILVFQFDGLRILKKVFDEC